MTINQKHTCNINSAFIGWEESSGGNGNLNKKMRRNVLSVRDPHRRKDNDWRWAMLFVGGGSMAGWGKSACSALPEPPCCRAQGKCESYANSGAEIWACSDCGFAIADEFTLLHRACLFSSSRLCNHLSPARPRRFSVPVKQMCHS